jgi:hypothetical protein
MHENTVNLKNAEEDGGQDAAFSKVPFPKTRSEHEERPKRRRRFAKAVLGIAVIVVLAWLWSVFSSWMAWRAVFLSNNQVYFGHFLDVPFASTITLNDVYYLQVALSNEQLAGTSQSSLKLVKLGSEIHGPTDQMVIPISQILFWETLRPDSAIVTTIKNGQPQTNP